MNVQLQEGVGLEIRNFNNTDLEIISLRIIMTHAETLFFD